MCIYTGMCFSFSPLPGAREKAGTVGDEIEAIAAAKMVTYVRKYENLRGCYRLNTYDDLHAAVFYMGMAREIK